MDGPLYELLVQCTCRVIVEKGQGTGFFIAPGKILTCAHVVETAHSDETAVTVRYSGRDHPATIRKYFPKPYPDVAVLDVEFTDHPWAPMDGTVEPLDAVFAFGYPAEFPGGESVTANYEGPAFPDDPRRQRLLKFGEGQIVPGYSGAPLLNVHTWAVCGVVKKTRDVETDLGGRAVPADVVLDLVGPLPEPDRRWVEAVNRQRDLAPKGAAVLARLGAVVYAKAGENSDRPTQLFGQQSVLDVAGELLDQGQRLLLFGLTGSGKTALAATLADQWVVDGKGSYAWLRTDRADAEAIIDALTDVIGSPEQKEKVRSAAGEQQIVALRDSLAGSEPTLIVLDDVWIPSALRIVLTAIPDGMPVLVTSQLRFPTIPSRFGLAKAIEIGDLAVDDAVQLLAHHAGDELRESRDAAAAELCRTLGYHAFGIEIAGSQLKQHGQPVEDLLEEIRSAPHTLTMPVAFGLPGREGLLALLDRAYRALDDGDARQVLRALGAMPSAGATVGLLAEYLVLPPVQVRQALDKLTDVSLAKRSARTSFYGVHDLTYSYARALTHEPPERAIEATRRFVTTHEDKYELLALDLANILTAAAWAKARAPEALVAILGSLATGGYIDNRGHALGVIQMLGEAIEVARLDPAQRTTLHYLLGKRGNAHVDRGETSDAVRDYREALEVAPTPGRRAILLGVLGKVLTEQGNHDEARAAFDEAREVAAAHHDDAALLRVLEQQCVAEFARQKLAESELQNYSLLRDLAGQGIALSRTLGARNSEATFLNALGSVEFESGVNASLRLHKQVLQIAAEIDDEDLLALAQEALGIDFHAQENYDEARSRLSAALRLYEKLGHTRSTEQVRHRMDKFGYLRSSQPEEDADA